MVIVNSRTKSASFGSKLKPLGNFFDRSLGYIQKPSLVRLAATMAPLSDVGGNGYSRAAHLGRETVGLLLREGCGEGVYLQYEPVGLRVGLKVAA